MISRVKFGSKITNIILPESIVGTEIFINLSLDDKLKFLETFVVTSELFDQYIREPYFTNKELYKITNENNNFAFYGCVRLLRFACELNPNGNQKELTCFIASLGGHLNIVKWCRSQDPPFPWDWRTYSCAAREGHLEIIKWCRSQDPPCPWNEYTCIDAAMGGHLEILQWCRSQNPPCPWNKNDLLTFEFIKDDIKDWIRTQPE